MGKRHRKGIHGSGEAAFRPRLEKPASFYVGNADGSDRSSYSPSQPDAFLGQDDAPGFSAITRNCFPKNRHAQGILKYSFSTHMG